MPASSVFELMWVRTPNERSLAANRCEVAGGQIIGQTARRCLTEEALEDEPRQLTGERNELSTKEPGKAYRRRVRSILALADWTRGPLANFLDAAL
jgi:hypothetical protein